MSISKTSKVLIFGDTHFDDYNPRSHIDYWLNVQDVCDRILDTVEKEKPTEVIFAGDFIGVRSNARTGTLSSLSYLMDFIRSIGVPVYVVKGNHDYSQDSAFDFLCENGLIQTMAQLPNGVLTVGNKIDIVLRDYNSEEVAIPIRDTHGCVVVAHNDFKLDGSYQGFTRDIALDLATLPNWLNADIIVSGHIHLPSERPIELQGPSSSSLFMSLGCLTRPSKADKYDQVWYVVVEVDESGAGRFDNRILELSPYDELFRELTGSTKDIIDLYTPDAEKAKRKALSEIFNTIGSENIVQTNSIMEFVNEVPGVSDDARNKAKDYLIKAERSLATND